ncbi:glycosyltransferase family 2 protein [Singulisphaera sp. PoT]|uniref:glycosyltransferase family 2 protein n=1 Tax=Singulisphaera sp. PoT TaxID=3411797 RepID=UPI003BF5F829
MMTPISIAIATYNRADDLARTLGGIEALEFDDLDDVEILVIDNNSSDATRDVSELFERRFQGHFRYVLESRQGLSQARNRAVAEARFGVIAFLDDDVDLDPGWLRNLASAYESGDYAAVGGRAYLSYPRSRPHWLGERDEGYLTKIELGPDRLHANPDELFGVNLSLRKEWIERVGGFRVDLGRIGSCLIGSEETDLLERIARAGGDLLYEPSAVVAHRVPQNRLRRRWFWSRSYWGHRGEARRSPSREVSLYEMARKSWHVTLAAWGLTRTLVRRSPWGEEVFHEIVVLSARIGTWVGLVMRLMSRRDQTRIILDDEAEDDSSADAGQVPCCVECSGSQRSICKG